jgi:hypothetical protein
LSFGDSFTGGIAQPSFVAIRNRAIGMSVISGRTASACGHNAQHGSYLIYLVINSLALALQTFQRSLQQRVILSVFSWSRHS